MKLSNKSIIYGLGEALMLFDYLDIHTNMRMLKNTLLVTIETSF